MEERQIEGRDDERGYECAYECSSNRRKTSV